MRSKNSLRKINDEVDGEKKECSKQSSGPTKFYYNLLFNSFHTTHINEFCFLLTTEMQANFCTWDLAPRDCHACYGSTPKRPVVKNRACDYHTPRLNMTCVGVCACHRTVFMARPKLELLARNFLC